MHLSWTKRYIIQKFEKKVIFRSCHDLLIAISVLLDHRVFKLMPKPNANISCNSTASESTSFIKYLNMIKVHICHFSFAGSVLKKANATLKLTLARSIKMHLLLNGMCFRPCTYTFSVFYSSIAQSLNS